MVSLTPKGKANQSRQYVWGLIMVCFVSYVSHQAKHFVSEDNLMLLFLVAVILAALYWGEGPTILVAFLSYLALDFGVFSSRFKFTFPDLQYSVSLLIFLGVGYVISHLSNSLRRQANEARQRAIYAQYLQVFSHDLTQVQSQDDILQVFKQNAAPIFGDQVCLCLGDDGNCRVQGADKPCPDEMADLLSSFVHQACLALQRVSSDHDLRQAMLATERERVQNALLNSLSHDLQTPLASIAGSLQVACDSNIQLQPDVRQGLLQMAGDQTERLRRLVSNLLQMTRLDGPGLVLNLQTVAPDELMEVVLEHTPAALRSRIEVDVAEDLPELYVDYVLVVNLLQNLLENAHKYTPEGSPIQIHMQAEGSHLRCDVRDRGPGVPVEETERIFDKFYRVKDMAMAGSGLGLFIAKGIIDAHHGRICAHLREGGGLEISCWLPCADNAMLV